MLLQHRLNYKPTSYDSPYIEAGVAHSPSFSLTELTKVARVAGKCWHLNAHKIHPNNIGHHSNILAQTVRPSLFMTHSQLVGV